MNLTDILVVASSVVIFILLWVMLAASVLKSKSAKVLAKWKSIDEKLRRRQDLVPLIIETFRRHADDKNLEKILIKERMNAAKVYLPGAKKIEVEGDLTKRLNELFGSAAKNDAAMKDSDFLYAKSEVEGLEKALEEETGDFNDAVRSYNKTLGSFFTFAVAKVFGYKKMNIFDVES